MALSARITLTSAGSDTGPFNLYSNIDGYTNAFESSILKSNLVNGFTTNNIPNSTSIIRLISMGVCTNYIDLNLITLTPTPTPTLTITPTPTSTPTGPTPTPTSTSAGPTPTPTSTSAGPTPTPTSTSAGPTPTPTSNITLYNVTSPIYTSYDEFNGNTSTLKYYGNLTDLYNSIMVESNRVSNIMETVKTDNAGGFVNGAKIYNSNNTLFNITGYMCYIDNGVFKYINIVNSLITGTGTLSAPSANTITGSKVLFPYYTTGRNDSNVVSTGWGSIDDYNYWRHKLNISGLTLNYIFRNGRHDNEINSPGGTFIFGAPVEVRDGQSYYGTYTNWICRPYFKINRRSKIYGLPSNYTIPDIYRGTLIEFIFSVEVTPPNNISGDATAKAILNAKDIVRYENAITYSILVGK
jgi:hypothetical protein